MAVERHRPPLAEASGARTAGVFSPDHVTDLPAPTRRYLRHAIAPGTPLAWIVRLGMARPIPYGFEVQEEATFGGITIPVRLRGGWWYGTDRFDPEAAAEFVIRAASF